MAPALPVPASTSAAAVHDDRHSSPLPWRQRLCRYLAGESGQATAEYALVLLGAAVIAIALITWATGSGRIGGLFDAMFDQIQSRL